MKKFLKNIPIVGWFLRTIYNIIKINDLKQTIYVQQQNIQNLEAYVQSQQQNIQNIELTLNNISDNISKIVTKEIFYHMLSIHQRVDQFIFDSKIILKNKTNSTDLKKMDFKTQSFLDEYYLAFENRFRGSRKSILKRYEKYLTYIDISSVTKALDIGCGRGEWVELLQRHSIDALGVDLNYAMVEDAKRHGVKNIIVKDIFDFLSDSEDESYDLITAFHIIEHIPFNKLLTLLSEIKRVLKPQGKMILETPDPTNLLVSSLTFYNDPTHLHPLPPDVVSFMIEYIGFKKIQVIKLHPFDTDMHIKEQSHSANMLNNLLFKEQDYMVISIK